MPERPTSVPEEAYWDEGDDEWCLPEKDDAGEFHGLVKWWRPDGTLCCETDFVHGKPHGKFQRFHENGETSREGVFEEGQLHGTNAFLRSTAETSETFPRGLGPEVKRAEMDYEHGSVVSARCYTADGHQCMENGEPFPEERPDGVPEEAHFRKREADGEYRWVVGTVLDNGDGTIARKGTWRWWSPHGVLVSEEPYEGGKLHGTAKTYDEETARLVEEAEYQEGERHGTTRKLDTEGKLLEEIGYTEGEKNGPRLSLIEEDHRKEGGAHQVRGEYRGDDSVGVLEYLDASGEVIASVDTGLPDDLEATQAVLGAEGDLVPLAEKLAAEKKIGASVFALVRAVGRGEAEPESLHRAVRALERPLSKQAAHEVARYHKMVVSQIQRFGGGPDKCINNVFEGIRKGGYAWELLRFAAAVLDDMDESTIGREIIDGAIAAAPDDDAASYEYTRSLIRASLGDPAGARESVAALAKHDADFAKGIASYLSALFPEWGFWPGDDSRRAGLARLSNLLDRTQPKTEPEVERLRIAIQKSATRLVRHRERLVAQYGERDWIVPDVSHLLPDGAVEVPISDAYGGVGVQHLCRQEWTRLTWLCWLSGVDEVALPERIESRQDHISVHMVGIARLFLAHGDDPSERLDQILKNSGDVAAEDKHAEVVELAKELALASEWFGLKIAEVEDAPDATFLRDDEGVWIRTISFWGDADVDLFDEKEEDDEDDDDD